jgi:hypothetical protein
MTASISVKRAVEHALVTTRWQAKRGFDWADLEAERWIHRRRARADAALFAEIERFCLFVGFPRSGGSLVGAMLDAHPDQVIAHEMGALRKIARGYSRDGLCAAALRADRHFAARGFVNQDDVFEIPGQWQGRVRRLRGIGDKNAGETGRLLLDDPTLLDRLRDTMRVPVQVVVVVRNPFDNVARIASRGALPVLSAAARYAEFAAVTDKVIRDLGDDGLVVHHEATVADPPASLHRLARFFDVDAPDDWVDACSELVLPSPRLARDAVEWSPAERAVVDEMIGRFDFLHCYAGQN